MTVFRTIAGQLTSASRQMLGHVLLVFTVAFVGQLSAGLAPGASVPALSAVLVAGGAAGLTAVAHYLLGLVPRPIRTGVFGTFYHVPPIVERKLLQTAVSVVATFAIIAGTAALAGATSVGSLPGTDDLIVAAIAACVTGLVQSVTGLLPERLRS